MKNKMKKTVASLVIMLVFACGSLFAGEVSLGSIGLSENGSSGWALGGTKTGPLFFKYENGGWKIDLTNMFKENVTFQPVSICVSSDGTKAFAVGTAGGSSKVYEFSGMRWMKVNPGNMKNFQVSSVCCSKNGDKVWAAGCDDKKGILWKMELGKWSQQSIFFKDTPTTWNISISRIAQVKDGQKLLAIGEAMYGPLHKTGLLLTFENNKWSMPELKPLANTRPHRAKGFTDIWANESGTEVLVSGWKYYYPENGKKDEVLPMMCRLDGNVLNEIRMEKLPAITKFVKAGGKIHSFCPESGGFAIWSHDGKIWKKAAFFPKMEMNSIAFSSDGNTGFITATKTTRPKQTVPAILQYKNGKWQEINL
ncbi:MAG: WD40 repeat domain-containing protein [Firmicutes bacterium]|nr:WD40 repeat domain-containing protein [Bacillota bacterium]